MEEANKRQTRSINIDKTQRDLMTFRSTCPGLFELGRLNIFHFFYCPISAALVDTDEYTREEYESMELLVLKLYDAGLTTAAAIHKVTGLDRKLVGKVLELEKGAYKHIADGQVTELGRASIQEGVNHVSYQVQKEIQFEAVTGTVLDRDIEQRKDRLLKGVDEKVHRAVPLNAVDASVTQDIMQRLEEYKSLEKSVFDKNIRSVQKVTTHILRYIGAYVVSFDYLPDPFIILRGRVFSEVEKRSVQIWKPTAISEWDSAVLEDKGMDISSYNVRADHYFDYLKEVLGGFQVDEEEKKVIQGLVDHGEVLTQSAAAIGEGEDAEEFTEDIELREDLEAVEILTEVKKEDLLDASAGAEEMSVQT